MLRKAPIVVIMLSVVVGSPWLSAQTTDEGKPCVQTQTSVHDLYKLGGGWDVGFIDSSKVLSKESPLKPSYPAYSGMTNVELGLKRNEFYFPTIRSNGCSGDATLQESRIHITRVVALKKNGRIFAFMLLGGIANLTYGEWQSDGVVTELFVYDPDGKGKFSHLIPYTMGVPYVPEWVRSPDKTDER